MFGKQIDLFRTAERPEWPGSGFTVPTRFKRLENAVASSDFNKLGRSKDGKRPHRSALDEVLSGRNGYEQATMDHVLTQVQSKRGERETGLVNDDIEVKTEEDGRSEDKSRGNALSSGDLAVARREFMADPFGLTKSPSSLHELVRQRVAWLRKTYENELMYHFRDVVTENLQTMISLAYRREPEAMTWHRMKSYVYDEADDEPLKHYLFAMFTEIRATGTRLDQWFRRIQYVSREIARRLGTKKNTPEMTTLYREIALAQTTSLERRTMTIPRQQSEYRKLTLSDLILKSAQIATQSLPTYRRPPLASLEGKILFTKAPIAEDAKKGSNSGDGKHSSSNKAKKRDASKDKNQRNNYKSGRRNGKKDRFCLGCGCRHSHGEHVITDKDEFKANYEKNRKDKPGGNPTSTNTTTASAPVTRRLAKTAADIAERIRERKCYRCGKPGHMAASCTKPPLRRENDAVRVAGQLLCVMQPESTDEGETEYATADPWGQLPRTDESVAIVIATGSDSSNTSALLHAPGTYDTPDGKKQIVETILDTGATHSLAHPSMIHPLPSDTDAEPASMTGITGNKVNLAKPGNLHVYDSNGRVTKILAYPLTTARLPNQAKVLLGNDAIRGLDISTDAHLFRDETNTKTFIRRRTTGREGEDDDKAISQYEPPPWKIKTDEPFNGCVFLSQKLLRRYLQFRESMKKSKTLTHHDITIADRVPPTWRQKFQDLHKRYAIVFHIEPDEIPRAAKHKPIEFNFNDSGKPFHVPEPKWTPPQRTIISEWAERHIRSGMYEVAPDSEWACRPHIAAKAIPGEPKDIVNGQGRFDIRICHDESGANRAIKKAVANYVDPQEAIERASGHLTYITTDAHSQFNIFRVVGGRTRDSLTVWTPNFGKIRPKRLIFGTKNGATYAQAAFRHFEATCLTEDTRAHKVMFQDDSSIFAGNRGQVLDDNVWNELHTRWADYLAMCARMNVTLKPTKTVIGEDHTRFYGHRINVSGHRQTSTNAEPIINCEPPTTVKELQRVLGLFNVGRSRVRDFARIAKPLHKLVRKDVAYEWTTEQQDAFDKLKAALASRPALSAPDYKRPFFIDTDASDDGAGCVIYQEDDDKQRQPIAYYSKAWKATMRRRPVYYREAAALFWGIEKVRRYALASTFPLTCRIDQRSLTWVKHSTKGLVNAWRIHHAADLDYRIEYLPGPANIVADALSRYPMIGPRRFAQVGLEHATSELLTKLPQSWLKPSTIHIYAGPDTGSVARVLRTKIKGGRVITTKPRAQEPIEADLAVLVPTPAEAPGIVQSLLTSKQRTAILIPSDLIQEISTDSTEAAKAMQRATRITFLDSTLTWLLLRTPRRQDVILLTSIERRAWATNTEESIKIEKLPSEKVSLADDGIALYGNPGEKVHMYVPLEDGPDDGTREASRRHLVAAIHTDSKHLGAAKNYAALAKTYYWPSMRADVRRWTAACALCNRAKARRNAAHGNYAPDKPRDVLSRWGLDYFHHPNGPIMTAVDLDGGPVIFRQQHSRTATDVVSFIHDWITTLHGVPTNIVTDDAKEFLSAEVKSYFRQYNIQHRRTFGYHPEANAKCERVHGVINNALRTASDEEYAKPQALLSSLAFAINNAPHRTRGVSPNELTRGHNLVSRTDALAVDTEATASSSEPSAIQELRRLAKITSEAHQEYASREQTAKLNRTRQPKTYERGAIVLAYVPQRNDATESTTKRSLKHLMSWQGPCIITNTKEGNIYRVRHLYTNANWTRSIANLRPWKGDPDDGLLNDAQRFDGSDLTVAPESFIACLDDNTQTKYHIAKVTAIDDTILSVRYYGTTSGQLYKAKFHPASTDNHNRVLLHTPRQGERATPYTGEVSLDPDLVLATNLRFRRGGKLHPDSLATLLQLPERFQHFAQSR